VVDGKIYAIGGWNRDDNRPVVEVYDPETDTWTKKADMPIPHWWSATSAVDGKIYAIGGVGGRAMGLAEPTIMMVAEYNPATDTWVRKANMPTARSQLSACAVNGKIYAIGGNGAQGTTLSAVEEYDPSTDIWTKKADMPMPTFDHAASVVNGKIYVMGGGSPELFSQP
jgi:N-acetylneuraminic acid mutarotase